MFKIKARWIKIASLNFLGVLAVLEGFSLVLYGVMKNNLFYAHSPVASYQMSISSESGNLAVDIDNSLQLRLHPYFGFTDFQPDEATINNYQFLSPKHYPVKRESDRQLIVGIFGGSVALSVAQIEERDRIISNILKTLPQWSDKEIIILNFAQSGYKQPQPLLVLNYFLALGQEFDIVINIDGFSDVALSSSNYPERVHLSMPSASVMTSLINLGNNEFSATDLELAIQRHKYNSNIENIQDRQSDCWLALCYMINQWKYQKLQRDRQEFLQQKIQERSEDRRTETTEFNSSTFFYLNPPDVDTNPENLYRKIAESWASSSLLMHQALVSNDALYFHFLQPNQYYPTERKLSNAEAKQVTSDSQGYGESIRQGYPILIDAIAQLEDNGVHIFNAVDVFDREPKRVYSDDCCHYNELGNKQFSKYIGDRIIETLTTPQASPKNLVINNP
ncbi:hypothetical protein [Roseofilum casamattae]|uniref:SGNH/GDSL hydrolase family protein n=1 Tax=Roseofilum casamattae BLCC-M143 TaxID=3022442 RepID=A0ABT7C120_9CYAN|nr:hypothetical protein [Roseofilum casamattae]MDJ1184444.1 hypothetical protein [Roseofilum casamattae BLCC-M143]